MLPDQNQWITLTDIHFFSAQYPETYHKSSLCGPFEAKHPKRYKTAFLILKRYEEHSPLFLYDSSCPGLIAPT